MLRFLVIPFFKKGIFNSDQRCFYKILHLKMKVKFNLKNLKIKEYSNPLGKHYYFQVCCQAWGKPIWVIGSGDFYLLVLMLPLLVHGTIITIFLRIRKKSIHFMPMSIGILVDGFMIIINGILKINQKNF